MSLPIDRLTRFSDRVANYLRFRPDYPESVAEWTLSQLENGAEVRVADIGSGTGKLSAIFLDKGCSVIGVEPNDEMRDAAESLFEGRERFESCSGTAESTGLPNASVDLVVAGQALHWFDVVLARREFGRILKPGGRVAIVYNERSLKSPLLKAYEDFLYKHARSYGEVNHRNIDDETFARFFGSKDYRVYSTDNEQQFDFEGLLGRYLSSSYSYKEGDAEFAAAKADLRTLFERYETKGKVLFRYETFVYFGSIKGDLGSSEDEF